MTITISLSPEIEAALLADAEAQGRDIAAVAADRLAAFYAPEPLYIEEGSAEEDAAIEAAIKGSFHLFQPEVLHNKMRRKLGLSDHG